MIRSPIQYPGPLGLDATVTAGTAFPDITVQAPLGPEFQAITEWTNNAAVDLSTLTATARTRIGPKGMLVYGEDLTVDEQALADKYLGA